MAKDKSSVITLDGAGMSRQEAHAAGRALRDSCPRSGQAGWALDTSAQRRPIGTLMRSSEGREPNLIPIRYGRMLQSPFAFFRGAAAIMAADLARTPHTGIYVQACGDCHLLNFGSFATPERKMIFDINDFDETLPAPWEWDLKRLAASFVIASLNNRIDRAAARMAAEQTVAAYRKHTEAYARMDPLQLWYASISVDDIMALIKRPDVRKRFASQIDKARNRTLVSGDFPKLTHLKDGAYYIKDNPPLIYHRITEDEDRYRELAEEVFGKYLLTLSPEKHALLQHYKFRDVAAKVVGVGSVGTRCGVMLRMSQNQEPLFLQIKEARSSVSEPYAGKSAYRNNGQRVVIGQKLMQAASDIFLGWTGLPDGRHFYVRQLRDMKVKPTVELFDAETMQGYARLCGWALARAHARSGNAALIDGYLGNSAKFDQAVADFAVDYARQNDADYQQLQEAVRKGILDAYFER